MDSKVCAGSQRLRRFGKWDPKPKISFFCGEAAHDHRPRSGWDDYRDGLMKVRVNKKFYGPDRARVRQQQTTVLRYYFILSYSREL